MKKAIVVLALTLGLLGSAQAAEKRQAPAPEKSPQVSPKKDQPTQNEPKNPQVTPEPDGKNILWGTFLNILWGTEYEDYF